MSDLPRDFGDYRLLAELGRGGMGIVYRAEQKSLGRPVALKVLSVSRDWATDTTLARFEREAQIMARLSHPDIVAVHDFGVQDEQLFISMELVAGMSLDRYIQAHYPTLEQSLTIVARMARALYSAHQQGIVHRDIKPSNILIDPQGNPKLSDFGLAKVDGTGLTQSGGLVGTPLYMSPEQAAGEAKYADARSDVYSLGAVMYELLTGGPPFKGTSVESIVHKVVHADPTPPRLSNPRVSIDVETICLKALAKDREKRYATALALAEDLERHLRGEPILARRAGPIERAWRWLRRRRLVAAGLLALGILSGAAIYLSLELRKQRKESRRLQDDQHRLEKEQLRANRGITLEAEAVQLMKADRIPEALEVFSKVAVENPKMGRLHLSKATCHWMLGQHDPADRDFQAYLEIEPGDAFAWRLRGLNSAEALNFSAAIPSYARAAEQWKIEKAELAHRNGDYDIFIALVESRVIARNLPYPRPWLAEYDPSVVLQATLPTYPLSRKWRTAFPELRYMPNGQLAELLQFEEHPALLARMADYTRLRPDESIPLVDRALTLVPIWPKLWAWRSAIMKSGPASPPEIEVSYRRALELCPRYGDALYGIADWNRRDGKFREAATSYRRLLDDWDKLRWEEGNWDDKKRAVFECARCLALLGRAPESIDCLRQADKRWKVTFVRQEIEQDPELKSLRDLPEFQELLKSLP